MTPGSAPVPPRGAVHYDRIHPLTIVIELGRTIRQFALLIALVAFNTIIGARTGDGLTEEIFFTAAGALVAIPALLRYFSYGYAIADGNLLVKQGLLVKQDRTIPLSRIQNINLRRSVMHQMLGLVDLEIETGVSATPEARISALLVADGERLKQKLLGLSQQMAPAQTGIAALAAGAAAAPKVERWQMVYEPTSTELFLAGASENKALRLIAVVLSFGAIAPLLESTFSNIVRNNPGLQGREGLVTGAAGAVGVGLFILFIGWIVSIVGTYVKYYNFQLTEEGGRLRRTYGLFNQIENVLPVRRIQKVTVSRNKIQEFLKISTVTVVTAGGFGAEGGGNQEARVVTTPVLAPVVRLEAIPSILRRCLTGLESGPGRQLSVARTMGWRILLTWGLFWIIVGAATIPWLQWRGVAVGAGLAFWSWLYGFIYTRSTRWSLNDKMFFMTTGWWRNHRNYVPTDKVQYVEVTQGPVQRWFKTVTTTARTATMVGAETAVVDVPHELASGMAADLHHRSLTSRDALLDGL